jgi:hypothetical protein
MSGAIPPYPNTTSCHGAQLRKKHRDNFTFTFNGMCILSYMHSLYDVLFLRNIFMGSSIRASCRTCQCFAEAIRN